MGARHPLPYAYAKAHTLLLEDDGQQLVLWAPETIDMSALSEVLRLYDIDTFEREASATLSNRIAAAYAGGESSAAVVIGEVESAADLSRMMQELPAIEDLLEASNDAPIIRMLNALLTQAAKDGASDIHIEPYERSSAVRFRVDGTLREVVQPNKALHAALISRLKIMAELDIAERRLPQDGRISLRIGGRAVDVRVSTLPSSYGERAVLRLLDKSESKFTLEGLGMSGDVLTKFDRLVHQPHGIVLVTGPTGSGKTTTLYASLGRVVTASTNVLTVEDPVEYELAGIGQTQVNPRIDLTFAKALRAILRQDPDVIMIGEIRDFETAQIAMTAAETGHLVLSTLHTVDATETINRIISMSPTHQQAQTRLSLASTLRGVISQRLLPRADGKGMCPAIEILVNTERVREMIEDPERTREIKTAIAEGLHPYGMVSFDQSLATLVKQRLVTYEEAIKHSSSPSDFALLFRGVSGGGSASWQQGGSSAAEPTSSAGAIGNDDFELDRFSK